MRDGRSSERRRGMPTIYLPDDDTPRLVICQGPPRCTLEADQERGCLMCKIEQLTDDGLGWVVVRDADS